MHVKLRIVPNFRDHQRNQFQNLPYPPTEFFKDAIEYHFNVHDEYSFLKEFKTFVDLKEDFEKSFEYDFQSYLYMSKSHENEMSRFYLIPPVLKLMADFNTTLECILL